MRSAGEMDQADAELRATICKVSLVKYRNNFYVQPQASPNKFKDPTRLKWTISINL